MNKIASAHDLPHAVHNLCVPTASPSPVTILLHQEGNEGCRGHIWIDILSPLRGHRGFQPSARSVLGRSAKCCGGQEAIEGSWAQEQAEGTDQRDLVQGPRLQTTLSTWLSWPGPKLRCLSESPQHTDVVVCRTTRPHEHSLSRIQVSHLSASLFEMGSPSQVQLAGLELKTLLP